MSSNNPTNNLDSPHFVDHIESIRAAKEKALSLLAITNPGHEMAETALACAWDSLFEHFVANPHNQNLSDINTISTILHKLTSSYNQIKSLEIKTHQNYMKSEDHFHKIQSLKNIISSNKSKGLSQDLLDHIQEQLNLI